MDVDGVARPPGEWNEDDYDVLADGAVVDRIMKAAAAPQGTPWMWTIAFTLCMTIARAAHLRETDCMAGHVRFELRNVVANYPFESSRGFPRSSVPAAPETVAASASGPVEFRPRPQPKRPPLAKSCAPVKANGAARKADERDRRAKETRLRGWACKIRTQKRRRKLSL